MTAWADPTVAASGDRQEIDLDWLLAGTNTLSMCAPLHEQARLAPVLSGLLGDLVNQAYEKVTRTNAPLTPTLIVMDEAGNTPARWLPQVASTCAYGNCACVARVPTLSHQFDRIEIVAACDDAQAFVITAERAAMTVAMTPPAGRDDARPFVIAAGDPKKARG